MSKDKARLMEIFIFPNGMVVSFDEDKEQMPEFNGVWDEKKEEIESEIDRLRADGFEVKVNW